MERTVNISTIEIFGTEEPQEGGFSRAFTFIPPQRDIRRARGEMFALHSLSSPNPEVKLESLARFAFETLQEHYFGQKQGGIVDVLQTALNETYSQVGERVVQLLQVRAPLDANLICAVIWGETLYLAQVGSNRGYLFRDKGLLPFFLPTSENLKDGDLVVLCTSPLAERVGERRMVQILKGDEADWGKAFQDLIQKQGNPASFGALILKIEVEAVPGEEEVIEIGEVREEPSGLFRLITSVKARLSSLRPQKIFIRQPEVAVPTTRRSKLKLAAILMVLLILSAFGTHQYHQYKARRAQVTQLLNQAAEALDQGEGLVGIDVTEAQTHIKKAEELLGEVKGMVGQNSQVEKLEKKLGQVLEVAYQQRALRAEAVADYPEESSWHRLSFDPQVGVKNSEGEVLIYLQPSWRTIKAVATYYQGVYLLDVEANQIHKHVASATGYSKAFGYLKEAADFSQAKDLAIDGALYILFENGEVRKFLGGESQGFGLGGFYPPLEKPSEIFTYPEAADLYIVQANLVLVFDKKGEYQELWVLEGVEEVYGLVVLESEKVAHFTSREQVYKVSF